MTLITVVGSGDAKSEAESAVIRQSLPQEASFVDQPKENA